VRGWEREREGGRERGEGGKEEGSMDCRGVWREGGREEGRKGVREGGKVPRIQCLSHQTRQLATGLTVFDGLIPC